MTDYKLVPVEPTLDMLCEGMDVYGSEGCAETDVLGIYKAMLASAPDVHGDPIATIPVDGWHVRAPLLCSMGACSAPQPEPDVSALVEALENAARSLRTISKKAGIDEFMSEMCEVRGYAESRAWCAEKDLAAYRQGGEA